MNTLHSLILLCALTIIVGTTTGCSTSTQKYDIVYTNDSVVKWKNLKLEECRDQSIIITLTTYDMRLQSGEVMSEGQVVELQKWLMWKCLSYYKLDI